MIKNTRVEPEYKWDTEDIPLCSIEDISKILINGISLHEYVNDTRVSRRLSLKTSGVVFLPRNMFGEIHVWSGSTVKKYRIAPIKLFTYSEQDPQKAYEMVKNRIIGELESFTSMIVQRINDIQTLEFLRISMSNIAYSHEFLVILLERYSKILEKALWMLFNDGPIHRAQVSVNGYFGNSIRLSAPGLVNPYPVFTQRRFTYSTPLNIMVFQTLYYIALEAAFTRGILRAVSHKKEKQAKHTLDRIVEKSINNIDKYHLWPFYKKEPMNIGMLANLVARQQNGAYREIFKIYSEILRIIYAKNVSLATDTDFPLIGFEHIYEIWAVSSILHSLGEPEDVKAGRNNAKMFFKVGKNIEIYWELKKPISDSVYLGSLQRVKNLPELVLSALKSTSIKPDVVVLFKSGNSVQKVIVGDVKFKVDENGYLPKVDDIYKVLGYVLDLKKINLFKGAPIEGLLIYPGALKEPVRLPIETNGGYTIFIHLIPLRVQRTEIDEYIRRSICLLEK